MGTIINTPQGNDDLITTLASDLRTLLADDLGYYNYILNGVTVSTTPSLWVMPPTLPTYYRIEPESGIECIIKRSPEVKYVGLGAGRKQSQLKINVVLTQFNFNTTTSLATEKIGRCYHGTKIFVREYTEDKSGINLEQSLITIPVWRYYHPL